MLGLAAGCRRDARTRADESRGVGGFTGPPPPPPPGGAGARGGGWLQCNPQLLLWGASDRLPGGRASGRAGGRRCGACPRIPRCASRLAIITASVSKSSCCTRQRRGWVVGDDDYDDAAAEHLHAFEKKHMGELRLRHPFPFSPVTATSLPYRAKKMRWVGRGSGTQPHRKVVSDDDEPRQPLRPRPHSASRLSLVATSGRETRDNAAQTAAVCCGSAVGSTPLPS